MSKSVPVKANPQALQKNPLPFPAPHKSGLPMAGIHNVSVLPAIAEVPAKNGMLIAYKDLNENIDHQLRRQKQQLLFAFSVFLLMGLLILAGQIISKPRMIASVGPGQQVEITPTHVEHYQYDKTCYNGENGEKVCVTRTSTK